MPVVQIVITVETDDPKAFIAGAGEQLPAGWNEPSYAIDGVWVDEEGDEL
jgi:hypothetical protein